MAILLNNVATTDKTSDNEISTPNAVGLSILIANAAVIANFKQVPKGGAGRSNEMPWGPDLLLAPQTAQYRNVSGFRVRSAVSGVSARVVAVLSEPSDPQALGATPYTAVLGASGSVSPGANSVEIDHNGGVVGTEPKLDFEDAGAFIWALSDDAANTRIKVTPPQVITGKIHGANGAVMQGSGFTSLRTAVGTYTITFATAFVAAPVAFANSELLNPALNSFATADLVSPGSLRLNSVSGGANTDGADIIFIAFAMG